MDEANISNEEMCNAVCASVSEHENPMVNAVVESLMPSEPAQGSFVARYALGLGMDTGRSL